MAAPEEAGGYGADAAAPPGLLPGPPFTAVRSERAMDLAMIMVASRTRTKTASAAPPVIIADRIAPRCRAWA